LNHFNVSGPSSVLLNFGISYPQSFSRVAGLRYCTSVGAWSALGLPVDPFGHVWTSFTSSGAAECAHATAVKVVPKSTPGKEHQHPPLPSGKERTFLRQIEAFWMDLCSLPWRAGGSVILVFVISTFVGAF
jgi:hypothetical protein